MSSLIAKAFVSIGVRLITESFLSKLMIESLRAWSEQTENTYDDRVVEAMAQALGVDPVVLKVKSRQG